MKSIVVAVLAAAPLLAHAYVGPGAGLGMIASLLAVIGAMLLSIVGLVLWPLRVLKQRSQAKRSAKIPGDSD
jgi:uncharacterized membrane protein